jgi:hypothetical protein
MPTVSFKLTPRIAELLASGVISVTCDAFSSGKEVYGRVLQPHPRLGVYPHQSYPLDELEPLLEKVKVREEVNKSYGGEPSSSPKVTPTKKGQSIRVQTLDDPEIGKVPVALTVGGVTNALCRDSLSWKDLHHLSDDQLNRRLLSIGKAIGADKAVSKIEAGAYTPLKSNSLYKWWVAASNEDRFRLITNSKKVGIDPGRERSQLLSRLGVGQYPFRGTDRSFQKGKEEEEEEEEEDLYQSDLERAFEKSLRLKFDDSD